MPETCRADEKRLCLCLLLIHLVKFTISLTIVVSAVLYGSQKDIVFSVVPPHPQGHLHRYSLFYWLRSWTAGSASNGHADPPIQDLPNTGGDCLFGHDGI